MNGRMQEWRDGWPVLLGAMVGMGTGIGMFAVTFGVFIKPMAAEFGWSRGTLGLQAIALFGTALAMPLMGRLVDRRGASWFILIGSILFAASYLALANMSGAVWQFVAILVFIGLAAGPATSPLVVTQPLVSAFTRSRGLALALGMSGSLVFAAFILPILQHLTATYGWRSAFMAMAPLTVGMGVISFLLLRRSEARGDIAVARHPELSPTGHSFGEALRSASFWLLGLAVVSISIVDGAMFAQLQPLLSDLGVAGPAAALLGSWYATSIVIGRLGVGFLLDRLWAPGVGAAALLAPSVGLLLFMVPNASIFHFFAAVTLTGIANGAQGDLVAFFTARYFGLKSFGAIFGMLGLLLGLAVAFGTGGSGVSYDIAGTYMPMLVGGAILAALASISLLLSARFARPYREAERDRQDVAPSM